MVARVSVYAAGAAASPTPYTAVLFHLGLRQFTQGGERASLQTSCAALAPPLPLSSLGTTPYLERGSRNPPFFERKIIGSTYPLR